MNLADKLKAFKAQEAEQEVYQGKTLLIDLFNMYIRNFAVSPTMNENAQHVGGTIGCLLSLGSVIRQFRPSKVVCVADGKGGSARRRQLFKEYKDNRRSMQRLNRTYGFNSLDEESNSRKWQLAKLIEILRCLPICLSAPDNVEADDGIGYLATTLAERGQSSIIVSTDKDFLQLVNDTSISVWNPIKHKMYTPSTVVEDYGIHPHNFLLYRMVTGDASDNIPGIEGIKEKTLLKHFPDLNQPVRRDIDYLMETAQAICEAKRKKPPVVLTTLLQNRSQLELNQQLMRLDDVQMNGLQRIAILEQFDSDVPTLRKLDILNILREMDALNAINRFDEWVTNTFFPLTKKFYMGEAS